MGFDLRSMIQDIKNIVEIDIHKIAMQIHIALEYNYSKYPVRHDKYSNNLFESFQCSRPYRK
jgi:hypothetical protein